MKARNKEPIAKVWILVIACLVALQVNTYGQSAPRFLTPIKPDGDTPVALEWESDPKGIYTVESSVGLNGDWRTVERDLPSQGATTRWTDHGNPDYGDFRHSTADPWVPYRFYRVWFDQFMATNGPIAVAVTNISNGADLGEVVEVRGFVTATQRIAAVKLLVDGFLVAKAPGPQFALAFETREFANGPHRLSVVAQDGGAIKSTDEVNELGDGGPSYGVTNLTVSFTNFIYSARLRFEQFLPEIGDTQAVFAVWASPRDWQLDVTDRDGTVVYRTFLGGGKRVEVHWDGTDTNGAYLNPQLLAYRFLDLGEAAQGSPPSGGGGEPPPGPEGFAATSGESATKLYPGSAKEAVLAGLSSYFVSQPPLPPPLEESLGPLPPLEIKISDEQKKQILAAIAQESIAKAESAYGGGGGILEAAQGEVFKLEGPYSVFATFGVAGQGHHPAIDLFGQYLPPYRWSGGRVRMTSQREFGPWGRLRSVRTIADESSKLFSKMGYVPAFKKLDDGIRGDDIRRQGFNNTNWFNFVNIGLYIGHSSAGRDIESGMAHRQSYVPIYSSVLDTMDWVGASEMEFGSQYLKWMAFYSCNLFRDYYRTDAIYGEMKSHFALPMNGYLHIMQAYATENSVHPDMGFYWTIALRGSPLTSPADRSVIGAWNYVCRNTQWNATHPDPDPNVARSVYWPECAGDYIYGYGPQTEPDRDPSDPLEQFDLEEADHLANSPNP
ncbi:MAG TPA: DUF6345 domain-containing protein [Verrucomicrobiota bacterium]|nr:DUF6345 domain-containing protein [Verrucomicrobiota bacterium]